MCSGGFSDLKLSHFLILLELAVIKGQIKLMHIYAELTEIEKLNSLELIWN